MANVSALGSAPISFLDPSNGRQYSIPLNFVSFNPATGAPAVTTKWPGWSAMAAATATAEQAAVDIWLGMLATLGFILPAPVPPALPAFTVTAAAAGAAGNDISIDFTAQNPDGTLNVTVATTQIYTGLNFAAGAANSIEEVLGTSPGGGTQPGLAFVSTALDVVQSASAGPVNFAIPAGGTDYEFAVPGTAGVLTASAGPTDAQSGLITAMMANPNAGAGTFDLTLG